MTRVVEANQMSFGQVDISKIQISAKSRDDIPKVLRGLQHIYSTPHLREPIFKLLEEKIQPEISKRKGRPGMMLWKIFVMGVLRLDLNCDYDRVEELVNNHKIIRQFLGHSDFLDTAHYHFQTIKDNVSLLTPELLEEINQIIVQGGHDLLGKKKENAPLRGRCDSFVVETKVHYPTDINLLFDAARKVIQLTARLCDDYGLSEWRQYHYNIRQVKRAMRIAYKKKRATGKTDLQKVACEEAKKTAHQELINISRPFLLKAKQTIVKLQSLPQIRLSDLAVLENIVFYSDHADRQIDQIQRRVLQGETIPHEEKVFSLFESHTEWISKGKAGVPVELGVRVCVLEDQHQFILHHRVMEKETDDQVAIAMVARAKGMFPRLESCSFDKAFHSPKNQERLSQELKVVALKRKGKLSIKQKEHEASPEFKKARHKHAAVESAIHALEVHGCDICPDHGIKGFKRYVALAMVARNIHRIGDILHKKAQKKLVPQNSHNRDGTLLLAA